MTLTAHFKLNGTLWVTGGYDATNAQVVNLQLEDLPALDAEYIEVRQFEKTKGAPDIAELATIITHTPASDVIPLTMPATGIHSYGIEVKINGGQRLEGDRMVQVPEWTATRIISIRSPNGQRKIIPSESTEYDRTYGWAAAQNEMVDSSLELGLQKPAYVTPFVPDLSKGYRIRIVLTGNILVRNPAIAPPDYSLILLALRQNAAGTHAVAFDTKWKLGNAGEPTDPGWNGLAGDSVTLYVFRYDATDDLYLGQSVSYTEL